MKIGMGSRARSVRPDSLHRGMRCRRAAALQFRRSLEHALLYPARANASALISPAG